MEDRQQEIRLNTKKAFTISSIALAILGVICIRQWGVIKKLSGQVEEVTQAARTLNDQNLALSYHLGQEKIASRGIGRIRTTA